MRRTAARWFGSLCLLLGACHAAPDDPAAIGTDEQQQLNDAAAMLDANSVSANLILDNQTGPHP